MTNRLAIQIKNQQRNSRIECYHRSNGTDRYLQSITTCNSTVYIPLSSPWNFLQNRPYLRAWSNLNKYKKIEITPCILFDHNGIKLELYNKRNSRKYSNTL
jgi:hypothetical protein